jgi:hypothetical protein
VSPVMAAAYVGLWELVQQLIKEFKVNVKNINLFDNWTILHIIAANKHNIKPAKFIINAAKGLINYQ